MKYKSPKSKNTQLKRDKIISAKINEKNKKQILDFVFKLIDENNRLEKKALEEISQNVVIN